VGRSRHGGPATRRLLAYSTNHGDSWSARPTASTRTLGTRTSNQHDLGRRRRHGRTWPGTARRTPDPAAPTTTGTSTSRRSETRTPPSRRSSIASIPEQHSPRRCLPAREFSAFAGGDRSYSTSPAPGRAGWKRHTSRSRTTLAGRSTSGIWYAGQIGGRRAGNGLQDTNWCARSGG